MLPRVRLRSPSTRLIAFLALQALMLRRVRAFFPGQLVFRKHRRCHTFHAGCVVSRSVFLRVAPQSNALEQSPRRRAHSSALLSGLTLTSARADDFERGAREALAKRCGVIGGDMVLVLVSGGSDSIALLHVLAATAPHFDPPLRIRAVHFNHDLRSESAAEAEFVRGVAASLGVPSEVHVWADGATLRSNPAGLQERARNWRRTESRAILAEAMSRRGSAASDSSGGGGGGRGWIATGHHADDQTETLLLKLLRGAHLTSLRGMAWASPPFIRPFLSTPKARLVSYLTVRGLPWVEDASNAAPKYRRNRVRLELVPLMAELAGGKEALRARLGDLAGQSEIAGSFLRAEADVWRRRHLQPAAGDRSGGAIGSDGGVVGGGDNGSILRDSDSSLGGGSSSSDSDGCGSIGAGGDGGDDLKDDEEEDFVMGSDVSALPYELPLAPLLAAEVAEAVRQEVLYSFVGARAGGGGAMVPYAQLRRLQRQLEQPARRWTLELGNGVAARRNGDVLLVETMDKRLADDGPDSNSADSDGSSISGGGRSVDTYHNDAESGDVVAASSSNGEDAEVPVSAPAGWRAEAHRLNGSGVDGCAAADSDDNGGVILYNVPAGARLTVRPRRDGDRFRPAWRERPTRLVDFLRGQGVPLHRRDNVPLVCYLEESEEQGSAAVLAVYPSHAAAGFDADTTGVAPVRVRVWTAVGLRYSGG